MLIRDFEKAKLLVDELSHVRKARAIFGAKYYEHGMPRAATKKAHVLVGWERGSTSEEPPYPQYQEHSRVEISIQTAEVLLKALEEKLLKDLQDIGIWESLAPAAPPSAPPVEQKPELHF